MMMISGLMMSKCGLCPGFSNGRKLQDAFLREAV